MSQPLETLAKSNAGRDDKCHTERDEEREMLRDDARKLDDSRHHTRTAPLLFSEFIFAKAFCGRFFTVCSLCDNEFQGGTPQ